MKSNNFLLFSFGWELCRLISRAWEVAGTRYDNPKLAKQSSSSLFGGEAGVKLLEFWHCRTNGGNFTTLKQYKLFLHNSYAIHVIQIGPFAVAWINYFKKVSSLFCKQYKLFS